MIDRGEIRHYAPLAELPGVVAGHANGGVLEGLFQQLRESAQ